MTALLRTLAALGLLLAGLTFAGPLAAQQGGAATATKKQAAPAPRSGPLGDIGNSKEPVHIEAARLQVYDKEQRAVYIGDVVAVQGKSTLRCSKLTIFYDNKKGNDAKPAAAAPATATATADNGQQQGTSIKKMICEGPVSVVSCTQTATGDHGVYEAESDLVTLTGNVVLADGPNVQNGDKMVYNLKDGTAVVTAAQPNTGRVGGIFIPGSDAAKRNDKNPKKGATATAAKAPPPAPAKPNGCS